MQVRLKAASVSSLLPRRTLSCSLPSHPPVHHTRSIPPIQYPNTAVDKFGRRSGWVRVTVAVGQGTPQSCRWDAPPKPNMRPAQALAAGCCAGATTSTRRDRSMAWITLTLKSLWDSQASVSPLLSEK